LANSIQMKVTRVFDILDKLKAEHKKPDILSGKENKQWVNYSTDDFISYAGNVSSGLLALGLQPKDKIAIISNNRPEWNFVDFGAQQVDIITVPVYPTISVNDLKFILNEAEVKAVFFSSKDIYKKLAEINEQIPNVKYVYSFNETEGVNHFTKLIDLGKNAGNEERIAAIKKSIRPEDMFSILYTSGTTGTPKGVMISHRNMISNVEAAQCLAPFAPHWRSLSFLPLNHVYERMLCNLYLFMGTSIYYAEGLETIGDNLREVKPQIFVSVPRLLERVYDRLVAAGEKLGGAKKKIFFWALDLALKYELNGKNGAWYEFKRKIADKLVYSKWRAALGGNIVAVASGGAALQPRLARVFLCANIVILEGYGLTETCVVVAVNNFAPDSIRIGTVGPVVGENKVKIAEDGEILVKGPSVMMGYYKHPEATAEVIDSEGWFHTGDIGTFVEERFLKITDRKKEIFKTSSGKYIAPLMIENMLKESRFIEQCMVIGEGQKFASALIVPAFDYIKEWCRQNGIGFTSNESMIENKELKAAIGKDIREMNKTLSPYEQIKRPELLGQIWSVEGGELTPKLSLKRKIIMEKYKDAVSKIFASGEE
jgi:long-chain acyl-CoA synthetase